MKHLLIAVAAASALTAVTDAQVTPLYENFGVVNGSPTIDALAFANYGRFDVFGTLPFDFNSTRYFTNRGTMISQPGFRFDTGTNLGAAKPAIAFVNETGGSIRATDAASGVANTFTGQILSPSYLLVSADTIVNHGYMVTGAAGLLRLTGRDVDLSRGGIGIGRLEVTSTHFAGDTNYFPDPGIYDQYWGGETNQVMGVANLISISKTSTNVTSPFSLITNGPFGFPGFDSLALVNPVSSVFTNAGGADPDTGRITNILVQAAFVAVSDTNLGATIKWAPSTILTNPFKTAVIEISLPETNTVTGDIESSTLYLRDLLASWTNQVFLENLAAFPTTYIPASFELTRTPPLDFLTGATGNGKLTNTLFFNAKDTNFIPFVTNFYAAYSARIDSLASQPPQVPGLTSANDNPGRVEIVAQNLNMSRTRVRGTGLISINTSNLIGSQGILLDSENIAYDLAVPTGTLQMQGIARERVVRLNGSLSAWSGVWTNFYGTLATNKVDDGSGTGTLTNVVTNLVTEIDTHVLIVDATGLQATKPVITHDFISHAPEVVVNDPMTIVRKLLLDTDKFTLNARMTLQGDQEDWSAATAPHLKSFTSKGTLTVTDVANFGADRTTPYETFSNLGFIGANGLLFASTAFENSGTITSRVDGIIINATTAQFQGGSTFSARDLNIVGTDIRFNSATNGSVGKLTLRATHSLSDTGDGANNVFRTRDGFDLPIKPALGDLLGTTIESMAPRFARVEYSWAGEDRGASASGFENNVAIGHLVLGGDREVLHAFRGATGKNGLYVDLLELTGPLTNAVVSGDLSAALEVDPSLTIYFSDSNIPAAQLEELSNGRLVHVEFAGPDNVVQVPVRSGGSSVAMERIVRQSTVIDTDGDGIANAYDAYPLDFDAPLTLKGFRVNDLTSIALSWPAQPQINYQVEYATDLQNPTWKALATYTNSDSATQTAVVQDSMTGNHAQRYYRVRSAQ